MYARAPQAPHEVNEQLASPSERIAANLSPLVWGISARTLRYLDRESLKGVGSRVTPGTTVGHASAGPDACPTLPLELFDPECEDRSPAEWVRHGAAHGGTRARTQWYNMSTGEYEQRVVRVLSYSDSSRTYNVVFQLGGVHKQVKRLNLRFDEESPEAFRKRLARAQAARAECEKMLRRQLYLEADEVMDVLDIYRFDAKVGACGNTRIGTGHRDW
jgi:hypothetical protein